MDNNTNSQNLPVSQPLQPASVDLDYSKTPNPQTPPPTPLKTPDVPTSSQILPKHHNFPLHKVLLIALITLATIFITAYVGVYYLLNQQLDKITKARSGASPISQTTPTIGFPSGTSSTADWKTYTNNDQHYSIQYPVELTVGNQSEATTFDFPKETKKDYYFGKISITHKTVSRNEDIKTLLEDTGVDTEFDVMSVTFIPITIAGRDGIFADSVPGAYYSSFAAVAIYPNIFLFRLDTNTGTVAPVSEKAIFKSMLSTFKFLKTSATPTCTPRPACLDLEPRCLMPETSNMCPKTTPTTNQIACTQEAKLCPDGKTYVSRTGPNCEFTPCPE